MQKVFFFTSFIQKNYLLLTILFVSLALRLYFAHLDPYLHEWDERFHALVAKNFMENPLMPLLRKSPIVPYDLYGWCCNSVWLHKQPLFMWQMALSMKLFGVSEFAIRYPSVVMGTIMVLLTYRITFLLTRNKRTSLLAALLLCFSNYQLEQTSGLIGMDHNDVAFSFYILLSIWSYCEFIIHKKKHHLLLIGFFVGCAVLNKWLVGMLVFLPWGFIEVKSFLKTKNLTTFFNILLALLISILTAGPWQAYILLKFPDLARYEYAYNSKHIWEVLEGHSGSYLYYWHNFPDYFGPYIFYLIPLGFIRPVQNVFLA